MKFSQSDLGISWAADHIVILILAFLARCEISLETGRKFAGSDDKNTTTLNHKSKCLI